MRCHEALPLVHLVLLLTLTYGTMRIKQEKEVRITYLNALKEGNCHQRFFQSGVRRILPDGARHLRRLQCRTVRDMAYELEMHRDGRSE